MTQTVEVEKLKGFSDAALREAKHFTGINYADLDLETASNVAGGALISKLIHARLKDVAPEQGTFFGPFVHKESARLAQRRVGPIARELKWVAPGKTVNGRSNPAHAADIVQVTKQNIELMLGVNEKQYAALTGVEFKPGFFLRVTRVY